MQQAIRLAPGEDLMGALERALAESGQQAGFVLAGIGSLDRAAVRHAGMPAATIEEGRFEIVSLAGSLSPDGAHLHMAIADHQGQVRGGHVKPGCRVATTAEILLAWLPELRFARTFDPASGYRELAIIPRTPQD